jgi:hypothetical protein
MSSLTANAWVNLTSSLNMSSQLWPYVTPGIPDDLFEQLPGIPLSKREVRLLLISAYGCNPTPCYGISVLGRAPFQ